MSEPTAAPAPASTPAMSVPRAAWQPFTPKGIAAFAAASFGRLFVLQMMVAALGASAVVWFLSFVWFPAVRESIKNLPGQGAIRAGQLELPSGTTERLLTNRFLTFAIRIEPQRRQTFSADVFVVFRQKHFEVCSLFGCADFYYPKPNAPFNALELEAQWRAWEPMLLGIAATGTALGLLFWWWILATLYFVWVWLFAFFADRELNWGGSWRLSAAGLLPGTVLLIAAIVGYGLSAVDLIRLLIIAILHMVAPWILIVVATLTLPKVTTKSGSNPFVPAFVKPEQTPPAKPSRQ